MRCFITIRVCVETRAAADWFCFNMMRAHRPCPWCWTSNWNMRSRAWNRQHMHLCHNKGHNKDKGLARTWHLQHLHARAVNTQGNTRHFLENETLHVRLAFATNIQRLEIAVCGETIKCIHFSTNKRSDSIIESVDLKSTTATENAPLHVLKWHIPDNKAPLTDTAPPHQHEIKMTELNL